MTAVGNYSSDILPPILLELPSNSVHILQMAPLHIVLVN